MVIQDHTIQESLLKVAQKYGVSLSYLIKHIEHPDKHPLDAVGMEATLIFNLDKGTYTGRYSRSATIDVLQAKPVQRTLEKPVF